MANPLMSMLTRGMSNSPQLQMLINLIKGGGNPQQMLSSMAQSNPQLQEIMQMLQGKNGADIEKIARQLYANKGMDINAAIQQVQNMFRG